MLSEPETGVNERVYVERLAAWDLAALEKHSIGVRLDSMDLVRVAGSGHYGSSFSCVELLVALYHGYLALDPRRPRWAERDRFILSKGHACSCLYPILARLGFFPLAELEQYTRLGSMLGDHPDMNKVPGVDFSSGSLGHGLSVGVGMAEAARLQGQPYRTVVLLGDGELNEGQNWEAISYASHRALNHLLAIVDVNEVSVDGATTDILNFAPLDEKWRSFGWTVDSIDGHDYSAINDALVRFEESITRSTPRPTVILAKTVAGKGIPFIEGLAEWHVGYLGGEDERRAIEAVESMFGGAAS